MIPETTRACHECLSTMLPPLEETEGQSSYASLEFQSTNSTIASISALHDTVMKLQRDIEAERAKREALEIRSRKLALHLYFVAAEHIRGVEAVKRLAERQSAKIRELTRDNAKLKRLQRSWYSKNIRKRFKTAEKENENIKSTKDNPRLG